MNEISVEKALDLVESLVYNKTKKHLTELQILIFCGVWEGKNYKEIVAKNNRCSAGHARELPLVYGCYFQAFSKKKSIFIP